MELTGQMRLSLWMHIDRAEVEPSLPHLSGAVEPGAPILSEPGVGVIGHEAIGQDANAIAGGMFCE
jgi:hypothetical protein